MSNYTKTTAFTAKDSLLTGNPAKIIKGAEFDTEFDNIQTANNSKANTASPTFTGTVTAPTVVVSGTLTAGLIDGGTY
jgi:predicted P-loop ATPase/GTPase